MGYKGEYAFENPKHVGDHYEIVIRQVYPEHKLTDPTEADHFTLGAISIIDHLAGERIEIAQSHHLSVDPDELPTSSVSFVLEDALPRQGNGKAKTVHAEERVTIDIQEGQTWQDRRKACAIDVKGRVITVQAKHIRLLDHPDGHTLARSHSNKSGGFLDDPIVEIAVQAAKARAAETMEKMQKLMSG